VEVQQNFGPLTPLDSFSDLLRLLGSVRWKSRGLADKLSRPAKPNAQTLAIAYTLLEACACSDSFDADDSSGDSQSDAMTSRNVQDFVANVVRCFVKSTLLENTGRGVEAFWKELDALSGSSSYSTHTAERLLCSWNEAMHNTAVCRCVGGGFILAPVHTVPGDFLSNINSWTEYDYFLTSQACRMILRRVEKGSLSNMSLNVPNRGMSSTSMKELRDSGQVFHMIGRAFGCKEVLMKKLFPVVIL
jgi:hypothetical protein